MVEIDLLWCIVRVPSNYSIESHYRIRLENVFLFFLLDILRIKLWVVDALFFIKSNFSSLLNIFSLKIVFIVLFEHLDLLHRLFYLSVEQDLLLLILEIFKIPPRALYFRRGSRCLLHSRSFFFNWLLLEFHRGFAPFISWFGFHHDLVLVAPITLWACLGFSLRLASSSQVFVQLTFLV